MSFARYFKISSYCLIGSGFAAIAVTGGIGRAFMVLFLAVLAGSWFLDTGRIRHVVPAWALYGLVLVYLPVMAIDYRLSHSSAGTLVHLFFFASCLKLLTLSKDRDYLQLYLLSFAELLTASTLTVSLGFLLCFLVYLLFGVSTLILFEMRRSNAGMQSEGRVQPLVLPKKLQGTGLELFSSFPAGLFSLMVIGITLLILAGMIPLFFFLPRVTLGLYAHPSGSTQFVSGFSDRVELGQIGRIKQSDAVVMRVKTSLPPSELPPDMKWRGLAFDHYDGRSWRRSDQARHEIPIEGWYYKLEDSAQGTHWINQTFFIEALSTNVVFAAHKVLAVSRDVGSLKRDSGESLYTAQHWNNKLRYFAVSDPIQPDPVNITDLAQIPPEILHTYLQLPAADPRIADLARQVTRAVKGRYAKARELETYLRSHYAYSLVLSGTPNSKDPLAMFLFDVRAGHCEYFASAMTLMLRQIGIPARLVNGFRSGEYNRIGDNWTVRQYHAHSWVEAYFPPYGWIEFDPTPPDPQHPRSVWVRLMSEVADAVDLFWWEGIINYDSSKQYHVRKALNATAHNLQRGVRNVWAFAHEIHSPHLALALIRRWTLWVPCICIAAVLWIAPVRRRVLGIAEHALHWRNSRMAATDFYARALDLLCAHGLKRSRGQTPMEFARSLGSHPASVSFLALTHMYNAVRFGPVQVPFPYAQAEALLGLLRESLHRSG